MNIFIFKILITWIHIITYWWQQINLIFLTYIYTYYILHLPSYSLTSANMYSPYPYCFSLFQFHYISSADLDFIFLINWIFFICIFYFYCKIIKLKNYFFYKNKNIKKLKILYYDEFFDLLIIIINILVLVFHWSNFYNNIISLFDW